MFLKPLINKILLTKHIFSVLIKQFCVRIIHTIIHKDKLKIITFEYYLFKLRLYYKNLSIIVTTSI